MGGTLAPLANSTYRSGPQAVGRRIAFTFKQKALKGALTAPNISKEWNYDFTVTTPLKLSSLSVTKIVNGLDTGAAYGDLLTVGIYKTFTDPLTGLMTEETTATAQVAFSTDSIGVFAGEAHLAGVLDEAAFAQGIALSSTCHKALAETGDDANGETTFWPGLVGLRIKIFAERADAATELDPSVRIVAEFFETTSYSEGLNTQASETVTITQASK